jgi:hypothetical protein
MFFTYCRETMMGKRYNRNALMKKQVARVDKKKIRPFLGEIAEVCERHGLGIATNSGFVIEDFDPGDMALLGRAEVEVTLPDDYFDDYLEDAPAAPAAPVARSAP